MTISRSPTETLVAAMEEFGADEPTECIVVFLTKGGDICTMATTDSVSAKVGMLEVAKHHQLFDDGGANG